MPLSSPTRATRCRMHTGRLPSAVLSQAGRPVYSSVLSGYGHSPLTNRYIFDPTTVVDAPCLPLLSTLRGERILSETHHQFGRHISRCFLARRRQIIDGMKHLRSLLRAASSSGRGEQIQPRTGRGNSSSHESGDRQFPIPSPLHVLVPSS
jgi:hypothetical protein